MGHTNGLKDGHEQAAQYLLVGHWAGWIHGIWTCPCVTNEDNRRKYR